MVFVSYSHRDEQARTTLDKHMAQLKREGVEICFDGDILPGEELDPAIRRMLKRADVFVALASPNYLHSAYCYETEYGYAIRKAARKRMRVVVAVLRACQWKHTRMARYKLLPKDGKPVDQWARRGDAYENIVEGIRVVLKDVRRDRDAPSLFATGQKPSPSKRVAKPLAIGRPPAAAKKVVETRPKGGVVASPRKRQAKPARRKPTKQNQPHKT